MKLVEAAVSRDPDLPICPAPGPRRRTLSICKACIDGGFTSVMIDGSSKPFEENIAITQQGGGVRPRPRRGGRGRAGPSGRHRGRREGLRRGLLLHPTPKRWRSSSPSTGCGLPGHRHRHQPRRLSSSSPGTRSRQLALRHPGRGRPGACPASPSCSTAPPPSSPGVCGDDQRERRQDARRHRHPRGSAAPGRQAAPSARSTSTPICAWP